MFLKMDTKNDSALSRKTKVTRPIFFSEWGKYFISGRKINLKKVTIHFLFKPKIGTWGPKYFRKISN